MSERVGSTGLALPKGITPAGTGNLLEGTFDLYLDGSWTQAKTGDLVRMPKGLPHAYYNKQETPARPCSLSRLRVGYASCSTSFTILAIRKRWFDARKSARWISCRRAQCLGHEVAPDLARVYKHKFIGPRHQNLLRLLRTQLPRYLRT